MEPVKCKNCGIPLKPYFTFCPNCGVGLARKKRFAILGIITALAMTLMISLSYLYWRQTRLPLPFPEISDSPRAAHTAHPHKDFSQLHMALFPFLKPPPAVPSGHVQLFDITGNQIAKIPTAVSAAGWVAIPARFCVGVSDWRYQTSDGEIWEISGGILGDGDDMGLWQVKNEEAFDSPSVIPARPDAPITWMSLVSGETVEVPRVRIQAEQINVLVLSLPESMKQPGVFLQDGGIAGWTFGGSMAGGYLWKGLPENNLVMELGVDDFYRMTFEGGREEQMVRAYAVDGKNLPERLSAFARAFRMPQMVPDAKTPPRLRMDAAISEMRTIMTQMADAGEKDMIPEAFDPSALAGISDVSFMMDVLSIMEESRGLEKTAVFVNDMLASFRDMDADAARKLLAFRDQLNAGIQKNAENHVVIHFTPDSGQIRARGILNSRVSQNFVVDTGASMVTIPSSAAMSLGLDIRSAPRRKIITAGGVIEAPEVLLDSVEFEGWAEYKVPAYIVDLPGQADFGLLGMNYLNRFHMNINAASGELTLVPR